MFISMFESLRTHLSLKEQNCWLITCQTISSEAIVSTCGPL